MCQNCYQLQCSCAFNSIQVPQTNTNQVNSLHHGNYQYQGAYQHQGNLRSLNSSVYGVSSQNTGNGYNQSPQVASSNLNQYDAGSTPWQQQRLLSNNRNIQNYASSSAVTPQSTNNGINHSSPVVTNNFRQYAVGSASLQQQSLPGNSNSNYPPAGRQPPPSTYPPTYPVGMQHQNAAMTTAYSNPAVNTVANGVNGPSYMTPRPQKNQISVNGNPQNNAGNTHNNLWNIQSSLGNPQNNNGIPQNREPSRQKTNGVRQRQRRNRTKYTSHQLNLLEAEFQKNQYPGICVRDALANQINVAESRVQVWFQNRRAKPKKKQKAVKEKQQKEQVAKQQ